MLILTEKENIAKNYANFLNLKKNKEKVYVSRDNKIKVIYAAGHLFNLLEPQDYKGYEHLESWILSYKELPFIPKKYMYKAIKGKKDIRISCEKALKEAIKNREEIVVATDPDREGEVIAKLILDKVNVPMNLVTRVWCTEGLNKEEVLRGLKDRKSIKEYEKLCLMGINQKQSDWVMGINLTRAYSILNGDLFPVGRVQTAVLKELYKREMMIRDFVSKPYYQGEIIFSNGDRGKIINENGKVDFFDKNGLIKRINLLIRESKCIEYKEIEKKESIPHLYDLAGLQKDVYDIYDISIDKTLEKAQILYNEKGVLSYPRTNSVYLKEEDSDNIKELFKKLKNVDIRFNDVDEGKINKENKNIFNTKLVQGHHGLIPSKYLNEKDTEEWKIYDLVLRRFMMQGSEKYGYKIISAIIESGKEKIMIEGRKIENKGWKKYDLHKIKEEKEIKTKANEKVYIEKYNILEKYTQKPQRYNEGTILAWMRNPSGSEEEGIKLISIGTQSTQATIVKDLFGNGYIKNEKKSIKILEKGIKIVEQIKKNKVLDENTSVESTAKWNLINEENSEKLLKEIERVTKESIGAIKKDMETVIQKNVIGKCPYCEGDILKGKGYYCSNIKTEKCENSLGFKIMGNDITDEIVKELLKNKKTEVMNGVTKEGKDTKFQIRVSEEGKFIFFFLNSEEVVCNCPKCSGKIIILKKVFKCNNKDCGFFFWKESSGVKYEKEMIKSLCNGEKLKAQQQKKDGSIVEVTIFLNKEKEQIEISY